MCKIKSILFLLIIFIAKIDLNAQTGLWAKVAIEKKITKKLSIQLTGQARFEALKLPANTYLAESGLNYEIIKNLEIGAYYRYINRLKKGNYRQLHRYYADLSYKLTQLKPILISYRLRYQQQFKDDNTDGIVPDKNYIRHKFEIEYNNSSKFTPFVLADLFFKVGDNYDQIRYKLGVNLKLNKKHSIEIAAQADNEINTPEPPVYVAALAYKFKF
jgi:hypothetical protein